MKSVLPTRLWQWVLLLTPSVVLVAFPVVGQHLADLRFLAVPYSESEYWRNRNAWMFSGGTGILIALGLCLLLGLCWGATRKEPSLAEGVSFAVVIAIINFTVAFAGCSAVGAIVSG